jgi:hypothetical protein
MQNRKAQRTPEEIDKDRRAYRNYSMKQLADRKAKGIPRPHRQRRPHTKEEERFRDKVKDALERGKLVRPSSCSNCNTHCRTEGHHTDYSKPLHIVWLCQSCHHAVHRKTDPLVIAPLDMGGA